MYVFGGLYSISKHLNDLQYLDLNTNNWIEMHKSTKVVNSLTNYSPVSTVKVLRDNIKISSTRLAQYSTTLLKLKKESGINSKKPILPTLIKTKSPNKTMNKSVINQSHINDVSAISASPNKIQKKRKALFYLQEKEDVLTVELTSPTSLAMKGSIIHSVVGMPNDLCKEMKVKNDKVIIRGEYPCERDGHTAALLGNMMIIFGGDRFQMSFNDLYTYDLNA